MQFIWTMIHTNIQFVSTGVGWGSGKGGWGKAGDQG